MLQSNDRLYSASEPVIPAEVTLFSQMEVIPCLKKGLISTGVFFLKKCEVFNIFTKHIDKYEVY